MNKLINYFKRTFCSHSSAVFVVRIVDGTAIIIGCEKCNKVLYFFKIKNSINLYLFGTVEPLPKESWKMTLEEILDKYPDNGYKVSKWEKFKVIIFGE